MSDPTQMPGQPSPEEMRAYLEQLREADVTGLVAEAFNLLATGAQVKLGRPDARTLIDSLAGIVQATEGGLPSEVSQQMTQGVAQLQMAQVQAEREAAGAQGTDADAPLPEGEAGAPAAPRMSSPGDGAQDSQRMTDRLWVPGRDPKPPAR